MKYIGIRGHRGAGKNSISYLLGKTIDYLIAGKSLDEFETHYKEWVSEIMANEYMIDIANTDRVYFDSFAGTLRIIIYLLTGIREDEMKNDWCKDHVVINLRDFTRQEYEKIPNTIKLVTRDELFESLSKSAPTVMSKDVYMTLREFILYFGSDVMQRFFGLNVWIKSINATDEYYGDIYDGYDYRIYTDVKTPSEVTYILNNNGYIVQVTRPGKAKGTGYDKLNKDGRVDYTIQVNGDLMSVKDQILHISQNIIEEH